MSLVAHTTYVVCVNFIHKWRELQFKVDHSLNWTPNDRFFEKLFMAILFIIKLSYLKKKSIEIRENVFAAADIII